MLLHRGTTPSPLRENIYLIAVKYAAGFFCIAASSKFYPALKKAVPTLIDRVLIPRIQNRTQSRQVATCELATDENLPSLGHHAL